MDEARKKTDKKLQKMEKKVNNIYEEAYSDISEKWNKFMNSHYPKLDRAIQDLREAEKSGDAAAIKKAKDVYERTAKNIVVNNRRFNSMAEETAAKISHTNEIALAYVNDQLPGIYSLNYNAFGEEKIKGYSFSLVNESAVKELAKSDKTLLPKKKLDIPKDMQWNKKLINSQMMQGILQGENIPTMAKRLMNVTDMNRVSAIRNARTMTTAAENKGRQDSYKKATEDGVIMKRIWVATTDDRTRAWHSDLDGVAVDVDEPWENDYGEIMFPGDPTADPANVYNCRCSIRAHVLGFRWNKDLEEQAEVTAKSREPVSKGDKNGLTLKEQAEIMSYKSFDYYTINDTLREKGFDGLTDLQKEKVLTLDSALEKLPTYSGDVSRSLYFNNEEDLQNYIKEVQNQGKLDSPAYLSTTKNTDELYNPEGQVQIYINDSKRGRDLRDHDNGENEVLYERNSKIDVVEQGWEDGVYVIKAKERR